MLLYALLMSLAFIYITEKAYVAALVNAVLFWCLVRALFVVVFALACACPAGLWPAIAPCLPLAPPSCFLALRPLRALLVSSCGVIPACFMCTSAPAKIMSSAQLSSPARSPACSSCLYALLFTPSPQPLFALLAPLCEMACCSTWPSCSCTCDRLGAPLMLCVVVDAESEPCHVRICC